MLAGKNVFPTWFERYEKMQKEYQQAMKDAKPPANPTQEDMEAFQKKVKENYYG